MHTHDPQKDSTQFQTEFEHILQAAGNGTAEFSRFVFPSAYYQGREFTAHCLFYEATFAQGADFSEATFVRGADFASASFAEVANFSQAKFALDASFIGATFIKFADFNCATFFQDADFSAVTFTEKVDFSGATFARVARFVFAEFLAASDFRETEFREDEENNPGPIFTLAQFKKPEFVVFYKSYLGQALFHNCDVSRFVFSTVRWRERPHNRKRKIFEEVVELRDEALALRPDAGNPNCSAPD